MNRAAAAPVATAVSAIISAAWQKFDPAITQHTNADGTVCRDGGDNHDRTTYRYKDRTDTAEDHQASYHAVSLTAIKALPYLSQEHTKWLDQFVAADQQAVFQYQGIPVQVEGWLAVALRPEKGEATNCSSAAPADVDWHLVLADNGEDASKSLFVEITPRLRSAHSHWKKTAFAKNSHLRIQGWLMYDPDHKDQITSKKRATLWEVHPVVKVWKDIQGQWVDLDTAP